MTAAAVGLLLVATAAGQRADAAEPAASGERPARVLFERAEARFSVGRFAEAAVDYERAYEIEPLPGLLFNVGQCYRNLGDYERAAFVYRRYLALEPRAANRRIASDLIQEMDRHAAEERGRALSTGAASGTAWPSRPQGDPGAGSKLGQAAAARDGDGAADTGQNRRRRWWVLGGVGALVVGGMLYAVASSHDDGPARGRAAELTRP